MIGGGGGGVRDEHLPTTKSLKPGVAGRNEVSIIDSVSPIGVFLNVARKPTRSIKSRLSIHI